MRENRFVLGADGAPRPARELLADPGVTATVLYRMAQSKTVGRKVAPDEVYAPFVKDRVPEGISPAAVLGPVPQLPGQAAVGLGARGAGGQAAHATSPIWSTPTGARCRRSAAEVIRIFVVTTFGGTVKPGGVDARPTATRGDRAARADRAGGRGRRGQASCATRCAR